MTASINPNPEQTTKPRRAILPTIARLLMGLAFTVFGLNGFFHFMPEPKTMPPGVGEFMAGVTAAKYFFPLLFGTQLLVGILLLLNVFVPLALVLIMPVLVNIILFHIFLQPAGIVPGAILMAINL
jgi:putative oxidoreductase